ncbi:hypothetical protein BJ986_002143 [Phycicoccus badiiscoriae]|uniref:VCBS repeat-containing protein n=1 Tax=Pedococcus badiiscoriae TaxID=642776 RepID=A0A852WQR8_9MICO|nr:VCBS repeat-containing protein [Pedococcus badiiscoriae]NYG07656.1 hypothetical protein [Pedococcus badiiscoriae]
MAATAATAAQATPTTAAPSPPQHKSVRTTGFLADQSRHPRGAASTSRAPASGATPRLLAAPQTTAPQAAAAQPLPEMQTVCPSGQMFGRTYGSQSFEAGVDPLSNGWDVASGGTAADGVKWATSTVTASETTADHYLYGLDAPIPTSGRVYAYFAYRTNATGDNAVVWFGNTGFSLQPAASWSYAIFDVTSEVASYPGHMFVDFDQTGLGITTDQTYEVDDVAVYSCVPIPNAGVRGDWTGEGTVDLLGIHSNGNLYLYPGLGNGRTGSGQIIGTGWNTFTWTGSPGDVTGDRRTDLVSRTADGTLRLYAGLGDGAFAGARQIGTGWQGFTALATPGDMDLDGRPDLLARDGGGALQLYRFTATGGLQKVRQVGTGWSGMSWIIGMGDLNGDRRGDVVAVSRRDGCLYAYTTTAAVGLTSGRKVGCAWGGMNWLTSPGDLTGDKLSDLVARAANGDLYMYPGRPGGGTGSGIKVGTGWSSMASIL